jgi:hypothetical protein
MTPDDLAERLAAIARWLEATPRNHSRDCTVEIGTHTGAHAVVTLSTVWIPRGPVHVPEDLRPLGRRVYQAEGRTLAAALGRLHVPRAVRRKE